MVNHHPKPIKKKIKQNLPSKPLSLFLDKERDKGTGYFPRVLSNEQIYKAVNDWLTEEIKTIHESDYLTSWEAIVQRIALTNLQEKLKLSILIPRKEESEKPCP